MKSFLLFLLVFILTLSNKTQAQTVIKIPETGGGIRKGIKSGLIVDSKFNIYISYLPTYSGASYSGLTVYNYQDSSWANFDTTNSILLSQKINNLSLQNDTLLWLATDSGLYSLSNLNKFKLYSNIQYQIGNKINRVYAKDNCVAFTSDSGIFCLKNNVFQKYYISSFIPSNFELLDNDKLIFDDTLALYILDSNTCDTIKLDVLGNKIPKYNSIKQIKNGDVWLLYNGGMDKLINNQIYPNEYWNYKYPNFLNNIQADQFGSNFKNNGFGGVFNFKDGVYVSSGFYSLGPSPLFSTFSSNELHSYDRSNIYKNFATSVLSVVNDSMFAMARGGVFSNGSAYDTIFILNTNLFRDTTFSFNTEQQTLNINNVSTVANIGDLSWNLSDPRYEVPKGRKKHSIFASALWLGALDQNNVLHVSAQTYRQNGVDFAPGPLDINATTISQQDVIGYKRIWKIEAWQIQEFIANFQNGNVQNGSYIPAEVILSWPGNGTGNKAQILAEFVDVNNDGLYRPLIDGDYPKIYGDQCLFWIMNDSYIHTETNGLPLGVELHCYAYSYYCPENENTPNRAINYTTFYKYKIHNRGTNNYHDMYYGPWLDVDLGNYQDDYVGCYPSYNTAFVYNGDSIDENSAGYGEFPPIQGTLFLNGPLANPNDGLDNNNNGSVDENAEKCLMNHFITYNNDFSEIGNPELPMHYYNYIHGFWKDSSHVVNNGADGWDSTAAGLHTNFMLNALPYQNGWNMTGSPSDRRYITSGGPFNLNAGQMVEVDYAYVTSFDSVNTFNSQAYWQTYLSDLDVVKNYFNTSNGSPCYFKTSVKENNKTAYGFEVYPNPNNGLFEIKSDIKDEISVYAIDGKLMSVIDVQPGINKIKLNQFHTGVYLLRSNKTGVNKKIVVE